MENNQNNTAPAAPEPESIRSVIREVIGEVLELQKAKAEPAHRAELAEERRRREQLERRVNELVEENRRARSQAEEAERASAIRAELQRFGVKKVDLAFRAVKDEIVRGEDGRLVARDISGEMGVREYLAKFVQENPELLPARSTGGSGASLAGVGEPAASSVDIDKIRPGMDPQEMERVRQEIARIAAQSLRR